MFNQRHMLPWPQRKVQYRRDLNSWAWNQDIDALNHNDAFGRNDRLWLRYDHGMAPVKNIIDDDQNHIHNISGMTRVVNFQGDSLYANNFNHFIDLITQGGLVAALQTMRQKNLQQPITFYFTPNVGAHYITYAVRIDPRRQSAELMAVNGDNTKDSYALRKIQEAIHQVYPRMNITQVPINFHQTDGSSCGFLAALTAHLLATNPEKTLAQLQPELLAILRYGQANPRWMRDYMVRRLEIERDIRNYWGDNEIFNFAIPSVARRVSSDCQRYPRNYDSGEARYKQTLHDSEAYAAELHAEMEKLDFICLGKIISANPGTHFSCLPAIPLAELKSRYHFIAKAGVDMNNDEIVHDFLAKEVDYLAQASDESEQQYRYMVLLRREKYLLNALQNDVSREKLIKHLQSFVAGRATLEKLKTNAEGYFYLTEQDEAEINQLEENTRNFYQRPPAGQSYRPPVR